MQLNDLLALKGIDPKEVLVMRHKPYEPKLSRVFHQIAINRPELYNIYQGTQAPREEKQLSRAKYLASFVGHAPGKALFIGLYQINGSRPISFEEYWRSPERLALKEFGMTGFSGERPEILEFDLQPTDFYPAWKGRLVISWPGGERSWSRWSSENQFEVDAVHAEDALEPPMPNWRDISFSWNELRTSLWQTWQSKLAEWRGIYFIFDVSDGKGYVGSAYGLENIWGRWSNYSDTGHGGNKLLRERDPANFRFSILERVSPDMPPTEVIELESSWKMRLSTISHGLNEN